MYPQRLSFDCIKDYNDIHYGMDSDDFDYFFFLIKSLDDCFIKDSYQKIEDNNKRQQSKIKAQSKNGRR